MSPTKKTLLLGTIIGVALSLINLIQKATPRKYSVREYHGTNNPQVTLPHIKFSDIPYDMSVLLISYHKTGHDLQMDLINFVSKEFPNGPKMTKQHQDKSLVGGRNHHKDAKCAHLLFRLGTLTVQHAPDLFCKPENLAHMLLEGGDYHGPSSVDKGTKVIHLVRNPFSMAVSNYHYHAPKAVPKREFWTKHQNPCQVHYGKNDDGEHYGDLVIPALSEQNVFPIKSQIVSRSEFDGVTDTCHKLYQSRDRMKTQNFHQHLFKLDWKDGLRLATAQMMVQGFENGGDILRMANNIVKFKEAEAIVKNSAEYNNMNKELRVYTFALDDFIEQPAATFKQFLDVVFDHRKDYHTLDMERRKIEVASKYEQYFREKSEGSMHITTGKFIDVEEKKDFLRNNKVFGPPLSNIESLVNAALGDRTWEGTIAKDKSLDSSSVESGYRIPADICC